MGPFISCHRWDTSNWLTHLDKFSLEYIRYHDTGTPSLQEHFGTVLQAGGELGARQPCPTPSVSILKLFKMHSSCVCFPWGKGEVCFLWCHITGDLGGIYVLVMVLYRQWMVALCLNGVMKSCIVRPSHPTHTKVHQWASEVTVWTAICLFIPLYAASIINHIN